MAYEFYVTIEGTKQGKFKGEAAHKAFKEKEGLKHSLLADMKGDVARLYGAWNEAVGLAERLTVVIGPDGKVRYVQHNGLAEKRDQKAAAAAI